MNSKLKNGKSGFTYAELIISIVIIAIMAGISSNLMIPLLSMNKSNPSILKVNNVLIIGMLRFSNDLQNAYSFVSFKPTEVSFYTAPPSGTSRLIYYVYSKEKKQLTLNNIELLTNITDFKLKYLDEKQAEITNPQEIKYILISLTTTIDNKPITRTRLVRTSNLPP